MKRRISISTNNKILEMSIVVPISSDIIVSENKNNITKKTLEDILEDINKNLIKNNEYLESLCSDTKERKYDVDIESKIGSCLRKNVPVIGAFLERRYENSSLVNFIEGIDLTSDDVDTIM